MVMYAIVFKGKIESIWPRRIQAEVYATGYREAPEITPVIVEFCQ